MTAARDDGDPVRLRPDQVAELAALLRRDGIRTVQLDTSKGRFAVTLGDLDVVPISVAGSAAAQVETVRAASVGEFLASHPARGGSEVRTGARVAPGELLGMIRTGLLYAPVVVPPGDPRPATLRRVLIAPGALVGYGTPLFELERH